jgi:hypothetical protein
LWTAVAGWERFCKRLDGERKKRNIKKNRTDGRVRVVLPGAYPVTCLAGEFMPTPKQIHGDGGL